MPRVKGVSVIETVKVLRANREQARSLVPAPLHHYLEERLLASSWYPDVEYHVLLKAAGQILKPHLSTDVWEFIGEAGAAKDFTGLYASVVRHGDPAGTMKNAGKIWAMYRDSGRLTSTTSHAGVVHIALHDYPLVSAELCGTLTGYYRKLLCLAGAQRVSVRLTVLRPAEHGPTEWIAGFE